MPRSLDFFSALPSVAMPATATRMGVLEHPGVVQLPSRAQAGTGVGPGEATTMGDGQVTMMVTGMVTGLVMTIPRDAALSAGAQLYQILGKALITFNFKEIV